MRSYVTVAEDMNRPDWGDVFRCGMCRKEEGEHHVTICEHMVAGDERTVTLVSKGYDDVPEWHCGIQGCDNVAICGDCWSDL